MIRVTRMNPRRSFTVPLPGRSPLQLGARTLVMGVLNVTPDSFADGGVLFNDVERAVETGVRMVDEGADIIDIGGESTRPGAPRLPEKEELRRVLPVVERLAKRVHIPISIDTYKARVAKNAIDRGATIINDISGLLYDPALGGWRRERRGADPDAHARPLQRHVRPGRLRGSGAGRRTGARGGHRARDGGGGAT